jgi:cbb3-type cytochrome oxidase maturation protein
MATNTTMWIVIAIVAAVLVLGALAWAGRSRRNHKLHGEAERIRTEVEQESAQVARREALADETAAKARAAKAEAEVKAAEAARLEERALSHRSSVDASRDDLDERRAHADSIDPRVKTDKNDDVDEVNDAAVVNETGVVDQDRSSHAAHRR